MHYSLALGDSGQVYAWGWNGQGQLALNDTEDRHIAVRVPGLEHVRSIAAGETHAVALTEGELLGWGNNAFGQIGAGDRRQLHPAPFLTLR
jgi:alpha-tubulin suppressor-like RCC1 family protein